MGVAVLHHPQVVLDPLFPRKHGLSRPAAKAPAKARPNANRAHQNRRRKSPAKSPAVASPPPAPPAKSPIMGRVRILKRGEEMASPATTVESKVVAEAERKVEVARSVSPALEMAQAPTQKAEPARPSAGPDRVLAGFYAGSAFITSPPPSSVPMPAFFAKKTGGMEGFVDPTSDLRRLLRLD
ncbi:hypothetical protein BT93_C1772 [Corymbia citriodora subsp. variegata]|nr:hypothetical protein BT93_C1772 [Corymbia citriodora subsp. variegata]